MRFLQHKKAAWAAAVLCTLLWGTAFPAIKLGYQIMDVSQEDIASKLIFAGARFALGGLLVWIIGCFQKKTPLAPKKSELPPIFLLGGVQTALQYFCSYIGVGYTSAANTSIITACMSFFVVLMAPLFFKGDRLTAKKILGCILGFLGVLFINFSGIGQGLSFSFLGEGMVLLSTLCAAGGNLLTKGLMKKKNPVSVTAFQLLFGGVLLLASGFCLGGVLRISSVQAALLLLYLALVSAVAFTLWTAVLSWHPVSKISIFNLLVPVFGTLWSGILLSEHVFTTQNALALVFICAGIVFVNIGGETKVEEKKKTENRIKGVVFDMDGVLLDTEKLYVRFWCEAARFYGWNMQRQHALSIRSLARPYAIERLKSYFGSDFDYYKVHDKRVELMDRYIEEHGVETKPGARETLEFLQQNGIKTALATATVLERTEQYLKQTGLFSYFDEIVCASMVRHGKPQPDIYLEACARLSLSPGDCLAVEDSPNGILAASRAGCVTLLIPDLDEPEEAVLQNVRYTLAGLQDIEQVIEDIRRKTNSGGFPAENT